jgi:hypothetical protein
VLLKTKDPQKYQAIMKDMAALGKRQSAAIEKLTTAQSLINTNVSRMAESLTAQSNLGQQLHTLDNVLDVRAKQYVQGMRRRAEEMFHQSMYHLVMSYRYEALEDLPDSFVNYDRIVAALVALDRAPDPESAAQVPIVTPASRTDVNQPGGTTTTTKPEPANLVEAMKALKVDLAKPGPGDLEKIDKLVLDYEFLQIGVGIVKKRQHQADERLTAGLSLQLDATQREQLRRLGSITLDLVEDYGYGGDYTWADARIADITVTGLTVRTPTPLANLRVVFRHSGVSIINKPVARNPVYYYFRAAESDDPITWSFGATVSPPTATVTTTGTDAATTPGATATTPARAATVQRDKAQAEDAFVKRALGTDSVKFGHYWPSFFSPLTLTLDPGKKTVIEEITHFGFDVTYSHKEV